MNKEDRVLKNCPFCGGFAKVIEDVRYEKYGYNFPKWFIECLECGMRTPTANMESIVKIWNRRNT